jgi:hypothetical protein
MGFYATAQEPRKNKKIPESHRYTEQFGKHSFEKYQKKSSKNDLDLVRLYKYKNSRIKRALSFATPRNKAKLA